MLQRVPWGAYEGGRARAVRRTGSGMGAESALSAVQAEMEAPTDDGKAVRSVLVLVGAPLLSQSLAHIAADALPHLLWAASMCEVIDSKKMSI